MAQTLLEEGRPKPVFSLGAWLMRSRSHYREPLSPLGARLTRGRSHNREPLSPWVRGDPRGRSHQREATITPGARRPAWPKPQSGSHHIESNLKLQLLWYYIIGYMIHA